MKCDKYDKCTKTDCSMCEHAYTCKKGEEPCVFDKYKLNKSYTYDKNQLPIG